MNEEPAGIMEQQILAEENTPQSEKPNPIQNQPKKTIQPHETLRNWFYKLKAPRPISYIILCSLIVIVYSALLLLSQKQNGQPPKTTSLSSQTPTPTPAEDPQVESIHSKVDIYNNNIDSINAKPRKFAPPNVYLDINFTDKK